MSEYDYSGLYNNPQNSGGQPTGGQPAQPQNDRQAEAPSAYPNVGSSGMNTANTAQTDYSAQQPSGGAYGAPESGSQSTQNGSAYGSQGGCNYSGSTYTGGNGGNGGSGYNGGYSYSSGPAPQPEQKPKKKGSKVLLRVAACIGVAAIGFGGGLAGTVVASRTGLTGGQVVVQQVQRDAESTSSTQGSTDGTTLSVQEVSAIVQPSVVAITTEQVVSTNTWYGSYVQSGAGSGVIISQDGYILTCAHVVSGASTVTVQLSDDTTYTATIVGEDSTSDVAVLKIDATGLTPAVIGDSDALAVGETAIAVGNPLGTLSNTVTDGIISALNREVTVENNNMTLIQTNASISPGNSGGGLFNANGELIGIVNAKSSSSDAEGLGFAIPINSAMDIAKQIIENGYVARPALGISVITISDSQTAMQYGVSNYGVYVYQVNSGSGAEKGGLQLGDRIISIDDTAVSSATDLQQYCQSKEVGDTVTLQVERDGKIISCEVTLGVSSTSASASTDSSTQQNGN